MFGDSGLHSTQGQGREQGGRFQRHQDVHGTSNHEVTRREGGRSSGPGAELGATLMLGRRVEEEAAGQEIWKKRPGREDAAWGVEARRPGRRGLRRKWSIWSAVTGPLAVGSAEGRGNDCTAVTGGELGQRQPTVG